MKNYLKKNQQKKIENFLKNNLKQEVLIKIKGGDDPVTPPTPPPPGK